MYGTERRGQVQWVEGEAVTVNQLEQEMKEVDEEEEEWEDNNDTVMQVSVAYFLWKMFINFC